MQTARRSAGTSRHSAGMSHQRTWWFRLPLVSVVGLLVLGLFASGEVRAQVGDDDVVSVASGLRLRLLKNRSGNERFAPRAAVEVADAVFVLDFGGWDKNKGSLIKINRNGSGTATVFTKLDRPHGMQVGPDGWMYVGESTRIFRFDPTNPAATKQVVVTLPKRPGTWKHPLTQFAFGNGVLYVNHGSRTDNCAKERKAVCAEAEGPNAAGVVLQYAFANGKTSGAPVVFARGLRNSMGLVVHSSGTVVQAENSRDSINEADPKLSDEELPHDELNVLTKGSNHGWPYCYDVQRNAPEFRNYPCSKTAAPTMLLPAHSAPLGMTYWTPPGASGALLVVGLHGYRDTGHRLVAFAIDAKGVPVGSSKELVVWKGDDAANEPPGPVGVSVTSDNALLVADDRRGLVLELRG